MQAEAFVPGDIVEFEGETYQVLENRGPGGRVIPFPSDDAESIDLAWQTGGLRCRRIGNAPLPAPTPCSSGECPTGGNPVTVNFVARVE